MTHTYTIAGMTCGSCEAKVKTALLSTPKVLSAQVSKADGTAIIEMDTHIPLSVFQDALGGNDSKYKISATHHHEAAMQLGSWWTQYKPVLLLFAYITGITLLVELVAGNFIWERWMNHFMAAFFLTFSFFKLLNLKAFAESYSMYDILAKKWQGWGYVYAFIELLLGVAFLTGVAPLLTNMITLVVMSLSIIGVIQSVLNKRQIKCACLGAVFNLPMSTITIIEDAIMIGMSAIMLMNML